MSEITLLSEADLRACVALDLPSIEAIEQAFVLLATAAVAMPPILRLDIPEHNGEVDVKLPIYQAWSALRSRSARVFSTIRSSACRASTA